MSQISKCPNVRVVLTYWEASREVSELSYKSLLYFSSNGSYCRSLEALQAPSSSWWPFGLAMGPSGLLDFVAGLVSENGHVMSPQSCQ